MALREPLLFTLRICLVYLDNIKKQKKKEVLFDACSWILERLAWLFR